MTYATQQDIEKRYPGALTQAGPTTDGELDVAAVKAALQFADDLINQELGRRWPAGAYTPPYPAWLVDLAADIALYRATPAVLIEDFADRLTRCKAAAERLQRIGAGDIDPPTPPPNIPAATGTSVVTVSGPPRRFTRGKMKKLL